MCGLVIFNLDTEEIIWAGQYYSTGCTNMKLKALPFGTPFSI